MRWGQVEALFDTGWRWTYMSESLAREFGYRKFPTPRTVNLAVEGKKAEVIGDLVANLTIADCEMPRAHVIEVIKDLKEDLIIGLDLMEGYDIKLDLEKGKPYLLKCPPEMTLI